MAAIQSLGSVAQLETPNWSTSQSRSSVTLYNAFTYDYAALYRLQPNVRVCVDFLARNIAQLGLNTYRRVSETDRVRLRDHPLPRLLSMPLPAVMKVTRYRLIENLVSDLGIYFNAYWLKLRTDGAIAGLLRIPPAYVTPQGGLAPAVYWLDIAGRHYDIVPDDIVHFKGYNPESPVVGLSPLETLRQTLAEEHAAGQYREEFWHTAARTKGFIKRPATAPEWSKVARERFLEEFNALYSGAGTGGATAVLEEGMEWQEGSFSPEASEYLEGRKLTREECARSYHIPLPMVGILDHATFSNISEQHKNLYQDSLGPWTVSIEQDIELQLQPEFTDVDNVYSEFNIAEKLAGSFEDQIKAFQQSVGRPWMTPNEARARQNMPALGGDADEIATPLNMVVGGSTSPASDGANVTSATPPKLRAGDAAKRFNSHRPALRERYRGAWQSQLAKHYRRQEAAIVGRVPKLAKASKLSIDGVWYDAERWNRELRTEVFALNVSTSKAFADAMIEDADIDVGDAADFDATMLPWLEDHSRIMSEGINSNVATNLADALKQDDPVAAVKTMFETAVTVWAVVGAISAVTSAANFGTHEAANAGGLKSKTWRVNSRDPRPAHAALNGTTIGIRETFANGQRWPGDPAGGAENNSGCECSVDFS